MSEPYYPSEIHRLLKLGPDLSQPIDLGKTEEVQEPAGLPFDLPVHNPETNVQQSVASNSEKFQPMEVPDFGNVINVNNGAVVIEKQEMEGFITMPGALGNFVSEKAKKPVNAVKPKKVAQPKPQSQVKSGIPGIILYPLVFALSFALFYVLLNFGAITAQVGAWFAPSEEEEILKEDLADYNAWIGGYYFAVGDREKLEANNDIDRDGLTNLDEFRIKTNPTIADSDKDGVSDGIEVINGTNPWGHGPMTNKQKALLEDIDLIQINNRISLNAAANLTNQSSQTDNYDLTRPGRLTIPKLQIQVPLIWTEDPAQFDTDLTRGVVHYPGTALPGERGVVYISGHSSDYFWKKHAFRQVFAKINALDAGDDIFVEVYGKDGKVYNFRYRVSSKNIYAPDDQRQFIDNSGSKLNLSTCWPIGTQRDRYVVTAELQE